MTRKKMGVEVVRFNMVRPLFGVLQPYIQDSYVYPIATLQCKGTCWEVEFWWEEAVP